MGINFPTLIGQLTTLVIVLLYPLPSVIALWRRHPQRWAIVVTNLIGGLLFGLGWLVALIWSMTGTIGTAEREPNP